MEQVTISNEQLETLLFMQKENFIKLEMKPKNANYEVARVDDVKLHEYVYLNPPHDEKETLELMESIALHGQLEPVKIWKKNGSMFIIEGRHRYFALKQLGVEFIKYVTIPSNLKKEDIKLLVIESETGRKMTPAQSAVRGWKDYHKNHQVTGMSMREYASMYHVGHSSLSRCNKIAEQLGTKVLDDIFNYKKALVGETYLKSLNQIVTYIDKINKPSPPNQGTPASAVEGVSMLQNLKNKNDLVALAHLKKVATNLINDLNNED